MPGVAGSHTSPFYVSVFTDMVFPGMKEHRPRPHRDGYFAGWKGKVPPTSFRVTMNGETQLGLPLFSDVLKTVGLRDPSRTKWLIGYNSLHDVQLLFCCPADPLKVAPRMIPPYPPGLAKAMEWSALGAGIHPLGVVNDAPIRGIRYSMESLFVYPLLCRTVVRKRGTHKQFCIHVPPALMVVEPGRIWRHKIGNKNAITRIRKKDVSVHPEFSQIPFTLIYDNNGNLIYFKHYIFAGTDHIPPISGCSYQIV